MPRQTVFHRNYSLSPEFCIITAQAPSRQMTAPINFGKHLPRPTFIRELVPFCPCSVYPGPNGVILWKALPRPRKFSINAWRVVISSVKRESVEGVLNWEDLLLPKQCLELSPDATRGLLGRARMFALLKGMQIFE
ncbi:hypothetical protein CEXT_458321 [Caerostris extrusa]|uniref:Uncharacterized protein n=1 Tax=Caerostris extrusa TaxID=172846 RepID=A0AAV4SZ19_CAEEX|nr:hypothetical protein CEXT_458321 [Caerostris extrusa]